MDFAFPSEKILCLPPWITPPRAVALVVAGEYPQIVRRLSQAGMISFTESPHAVNGVFGTVKPDGSIRLIVDARPANTFFVPPPRVCLPTPECLSQLLLAPDQDLFVAKTDLDNFYHRIKLPLWLHTYFALPGIRVRELDESVRRDGGLGTHSMDAIVFPCLMSLPMGWSFSRTAGT